MLRSYCGMASGCAPERAENCSIQANCHRAKMASAVFRTAPVSRRRRSAQTTALNGAGRQSTCARNRTRPCSAKSCWAFWVPGSQNGIAGGSCSIWSAAVTTALASVDRDRRDFSTVDADVAEYMVAEPMQRTDRAALATALREALPPLPEPPHGASSGAGQGGTPAIANLKYVIYFNMLSSAMPSASVAMLPRHARKGTHLCSEEGNGVVICV